jgi:hypothetical protein
MALSGQNNINSAIDGQIVTTSVKGGGDSFTQGSLVPIFRDPSMDGSSADNIQAALVPTGSPVSNALNGNAIVGEAGDFKKFNQVGLGALIENERGEIRPITSMTHVVSSGYTQTREGFWISPTGGLTGTLPTTTLDAEIVANSGDLSIVPGRESRMRYSYRLPGEVKTFIFPGV